MSSYEDEMFFVRLRRHAKWMFVFLALVFGLGFVIFGIGSDQGTGVGDLFRDLLHLVEAGAGAGIREKHQSRIQFDAHAIGHGVPSLAAFSR